MITYCTAIELQFYVIKLLAYHFPDGKACDIPLKCVLRSLDRIEYSHSRIRKKYYYSNNYPVFNYLNSDHFAAFLWFLGDELFLELNDENLSIKTSYLNKIMHGLDLFFSVSMPNIFMLVHPVGSVIGKASYNDFLVVYQNCTIGAVNTYPRLGNGVVLYSKSSVLGESSIGDNVVIGANSLILNTEVPANSTFVGQPPNHRILPFQGNIAADLFNFDG